MAAVDPIVPREIFRPEYVKFLLNPSTPLGFHVNVGDPKSEEVERIGAVRWMLIARSKVLRVALFESRLKPEKEFDITDLEPETFKHLLTFIYGYDNTRTLPFNDAVKLLGAAEKYDVADLRDQLAKNIIPQVTAENVCTVLQHGPVCETVPALWDKATDIVQSNTEVVFGNEQFVTLRPEAVVHILQQDALSVAEVDVWRAALKWARHQLSSTFGSPTPEDLRKSMVPLLNHTRLCTLTPAQLCEEVVPAEILSMDEFANICQALRHQEKALSLVEVCKETKKRGMIKTLDINDCYNSSASSTEVIIQTKSAKVQLLALTFESHTLPQSCTTSLENLKYECKATLKLFPYNSSNTSYRFPKSEIEFNQDIPYGQLVRMPFIVDLEANTSYVITVTFTSSHPCISFSSSRSIRKGTEEIDICGLPTSSGYSTHYNTYDNGCLKTHFRQWLYKICH